MKKFLKENRSGFTLIELLGVIAILAVLATLYVPRIINSTDDAKKTVAIANARTLASEITMYNADSSNTAKITGTGTKSNALKAVYDTGYTLIQASDIRSKGLLDGREFPDDDYAVLVLDSKGNCFVVQPDGTNIGVTPTPAT